ncbi:MAG: hypothetical protein LBG90_03985 [Spirochaetaceae bacterium]|jgi:hypothetical protein|nr:hypothetical protein [Spirochaetaceae bacterium]
MDAELWIDPETGLRVKADPETGKLSASVAKGAQVDLNNAQALREWAIANYKNAYKESAQENASAQPQENIDDNQQSDSNTVLHTEETSVKHDGEYVLTTDGSKDFGEISGVKDMKDGKIRLRRGQEKGEKGDYGEAHMERPDRLSQLKQNGYNNARDLVEYVAKDFDAIYPGGDEKQVPCYAEGN